MNGGYTRKDIDDAFLVYYDMKVRNLGSLSTLTGIDVATLAEWSETYNWPKKLKETDNRISEDCFSRMKRMAIKQLDSLDDMLSDVASGKIDDTFAIAKVHSVMNETRSSFIKERQYEDEKAARNTTKDNSETLNKLDGLRKDMQSLGINGISFDDSKSILDGDE